MKINLKVIVIAIIVFIGAMNFEIPTIHAYFTDDAEKTNVFSINIPEKNVRILRLNYDNNGEQIILQTLYVDKNNNFYSDAELTNKVTNLKDDGLNYEAKEIIQEKLPKQVTEYYFTQEGTGNHIDLTKQGELQGYYYDKATKEVAFSDKDASWSIDAYNHISDYSNEEVIDVWAGFKKKPLDNWEYILDPMNEIVILTKYIGTNPNVTVYNSYETDDNTWETETETTQMDWYPYYNTYVYYVGRIPYLSYKLDGERYRTHGIGGYRVVSFGKAHTYNDENVIHSNIRTWHTMLSTTAFHDTIGYGSLDLDKPNNVIENVIIEPNVQFQMYDQDLFAYCESLETVNMEGCAYLGQTQSTAGMFTYCSSLEEVNLKGCFESSSQVYTMSNMFGNCSKLNTIDVTDWDTPNLENTSNMFDSCNLLKEINGLDTWKTSSRLRNMEGMFRNCSSLESIALSNFNTSGVTNMRETFLGCSSIKTLDLSNLNTGAVTSMECIFMNMSKLESLDISNWNFRNLRNNTYSNKYGLVCSLFGGVPDAIPKNIFMKNCAINNSEGEYLFNQCQTLEYLNLAGFDFSRVNNVRHMFDYCNGLKILVRDSNWSINPTIPPGVIVQDP